ncbi:MAG: polyribonucleotide nucleotidyltransferase [Acidimicrobiia bacterium]|nr:polyribonucleotide nucleotidyltransferase [Acidimicrobiia bacterium]
MANVHNVSVAVSGAPDKIMSLETGKLAGLADGAVMARLGDTMVLVTATAARHVREGADFFPLTVDVEEKMYAAGKIPGSFFRREARAGERAILTCRLTDRPLRPSFPEGFRNEVHVVATVMAADQENPYDVMVINAASAALSISPIPFSGPIGAVRIAYSAEGTWIPHPTYEEADESSFEMVVAGRQLDDGDVAVMMVEAGGTEHSWDNYEDGAPKVDEAVLAEGLDASKAWIKEAIALQQELIDAVGGKPEVMEFSVGADYSDEMYAAVEAAGRDQIAASQQIADKTERGEAESAARDAIVEAVLPQFAEVDGAERQIKAAVRSLTKAIVRKRIVDEGVRIDGRGTADLRALSSEVDVLPTAHGSGLFQRGETQVLNVTTLGMQRMDQMVDGIDPQDRKRYMHHYNFPPFSTGETGFMRGPKRREIGHGALAERAVFPVVPSLEEFPYTIRLVSEVLSSNGSTSMGSVCSSSLSLMDAGVPIKAPVAGIAMGLVFAEGKYTTLTDILGAEDAFGDMDFKVAGTRDFVTALQLDTKIDGIPADVLTQALNQAKDARLQILDVMTAAIPEPRPEVGPTAPKITSFEIPIDKIGEVIGPKGKVINSIQAETGADISVDDDGSVGTVSIASTDSGVVAEAERQINLILDPPTAEMGATYTGRVVNITKFGAFVNILPGRDGLVHISKLGGSKRIDRVEDVVELGDEIEVMVEDVDPNGKISLKPLGEHGGDGDASGGGDDRDSRGRRPRRDESRDERGGTDDREAARSDRGDSDDRDDSNDRDDESRGNGSGDREAVSFEENFDAQLKEEYGDLGPEGQRSSRRGGRSRRGGGRRR